MLRYRNLFVSILSTMLIITCVQPAMLHASSPTLQFGLQYQTFSTHFCDYYYYYYDIFGSSTINTWEKFTLFGIGGDLLWPKRFSEQMSLQFGFGIGLNLIGGYNWEVGSYAGAGGSTFGIEFGIPAKFNYRFSEGFVGVGQLGLSAHFLSASAPEESPPDIWGLWFYDESFSEFLSDINLGFGASYELNRSTALSLMLRFTLFNIAGSADYGMDPWIASLGSFGINARLGYSFGH